MNDQQTAGLSPDAARIYKAIREILADRKSTSSPIRTGIIMRRARYGLKGVEDAQTELHRLGLVDIEVDRWDEADPEQSRFRYTLPDSNN